MHNQGFGRLFLALICLKDEGMKAFIKSMMWGVLNFFQVMFFLFWSITWQSFATVTIFLGVNERVFLRIAHRLWAPVLLWTTGASITMLDRDKIDFTKPQIFIFNHQSTLDIIITLKVVPIPFYFIAKRSLLYVPVLGWFLLAIGTVLVDRGRTEKAVETLKRAGQMIRDGKSIVAFPEGSRSDDGSIYPFKKGAFVVAIEAGVPIVPVTIEGSHKTMAKNTFRVRPEPICIKFGEPISTEGLTYDDREMLMNQVRDAIVELNLSVGGLGGSENKKS